MKKSILIIGFMLTCAFSFAYECEGIEEIELNDSYIIRADGLVSQWKDQRSDSVDYLEVLKEKGNIWGEFSVENSRGVKTHTISIIIGEDIDQWVIKVKNNISGERKRYRGRRATRDGKCNNLIEI